MPHIELGNTSSGLDSPATEEGTSLFSPDEAITNNKPHAISIFGEGVPTINERTF
jgi:hypothetical protein